MSSPRLATPGWPLPADPKDENYATNLDKLQASPEWDPRRSDVAILGCGALGLPLARFARERGLSSVYVGGLIQVCVLFHRHSKAARRIERRAT